MIRRYTVVWIPPTAGKLARLWQDNPAIRSDITSVVNEIDTALAQSPESLGILLRESPMTRMVARPPISILYQVSADDLLVRVIAIKLWDD